MSDSRTCKTCKEEKPLSDFYSNSRGGRLTRCKPCHVKVTSRNARLRRERDPDAVRAQYRKYGSTPKKRLYDRELRLKRDYGLGWDEYQAMLIEQQNRCAICEVEMDSPCVDHCHETGKVRALLCQGCNNGIGRLKDDPNLCLAAAAYLIRFEFDKTPAR